MVFQDFSKMYVNPLSLSQWDLPPGSMKLRAAHRFSEPGISEPNKFDPFLTREKKGPIFRCPGCDAPIF